VIWQTDPDLAGVRARGALARLPDDERIPSPEVSGSGRS
jgi:hypothetical protein